MPLPKTPHPGRRTAAAKAGERGFTLFETAVALVILMVAALGLASLFSFAIRTNSVAGQRATALAIAQRTMERLRSTPFEDASLAAGTTSATVPGVDSNYTVQTTVCANAACGGSGTLKLITVQVTPVRGDGFGGAAPPVVLQSRRASLILGPNIQ